MGGNRFLTGWWPEKEGRQLLLTPEAPRARLQIVHLDKRPRTLLLDLAAPPAAPGNVRVRAAGRDLGAFPVADPTEIRLPGDLPEGVVDVDLAFEPAVRVLAAAVRPTLPAGKIEIEREDLTQLGDSLVRIVRRVTPGTELVGTFMPFADLGPGQSFELTVERPDGSTIRRLSWAPHVWSRFFSRPVIRLPLGGTSGWIRVCLRARGKGAGARWHRLGFRGEEPASKIQAEPIPPFPKPRLVVVYVLDALRADFVGHLGGPAGVSPTIDELAREGITFREHRSVAPNTLPSTKALFTGHAFASRGGWKLAPGDGPTLAELFKAAGYHTGLFSGSVYVSPAYAADRGFEHVAEGVQIDDESPEARKTPFNDNAARVQDAALQWLSTLPKDEPAFLYVHVIHPHNPYDPPEPFRSRFTAGIPSAIDGGTKTLIDVKQRRLSITPADRQRLRGLYAGSLAYADSEMAGFLKQIAGRVPPGETLVAVTADHGEEHFEHGGILHGYTLFQEQLRIPLVLWAPGRLRPAVVRERTDTLDLHATLVGARRPPGSGRQARREHGPAAPPGDAGRDRRFRASRRGRQRQGGDLLGPPRPLASDLGTPDRHPLGPGGRPRPLPRSGVPLRPGERSRRAGQPGRRGGPGGRLAPRAPPRLGGKTPRRGEGDGRPAAGPEDPGATAGARVRQLSCAV